MQVQKSAILSGDQILSLLPEHVGLVCGDQPLQHPFSFAQRGVAFNAGECAFPKLYPQIALVCCKQCDRLTQVRFVTDEED